MLKVPLAQVCIDQSTVIWFVHGLGVGVLVGVKETVLVGVGVIDIVRVGVILILGVADNEGIGFPVHWIQVVLVSPTELTTPSTGPIGGSPLTIV